MPTLLFLKTTFHSPLASVQLKAIQEHNTFAGALLMMITLPALLAVHRGLPELPINPHWVAELMIQP